MQFIITVPEESPDPYTHKEIQYVLTPVQLLRLGARACLAELNRPEHVRLRDWHDLLTDIVVVCDEMIDDAD